MHFKVLPLLHFPSKSDVIIDVGDSRLPETPLHTHNSPLSPTKVLGLQAEIKTLGSRALELTPSYLRRACGGRHTEFSLKG